MLNTIATIDFVCRLFLKNDEKIMESCDNEVNCCFRRAKYIEVDGDGREGWLTREFELIEVLHHIQAWHEDLLVVVRVYERDWQEHESLFHRRNLWNNFPKEYELTRREFFGERMLKIRFTSR